ncbi:MAG: transcription antitermination factor NusB [Flavobacteriia bacterium]|nr:transcription antitermination factor NusB [Flavobacteriia bacterium]
MLTRRHIRIKVMQALFGFYQGESEDSSRSLKALNESISSIYILYLFELRMFWQFHRFLEERVEIEKNKQFPIAARIARIEALLNMPFMQALVNDTGVVAAWEQHKIFWGDRVDLLRTAFFEFWNAEIQSGWMDEDGDLEEQVAVVWLKRFYREAMANNENIHSHYEEISMHWADDLDAAQMMAVQTLQNAKRGQSLLVKLFKDASDEAFGPALFLKSVRQHPDWVKRIETKANQWEYDRLAPVERCLLDMALTEMVDFQEVPVKVSINEAIELAKQYGSEKSPSFINGILDALAAELKTEGRIQKVGRGLIE